MHAKIRVTVDGNPVAGGFYERVESLTVTDNEGIKSDTIDIKLNDGPPDFLAIPRKGAVLDAEIGYGEAFVSLGSFTVDKVNIECLPYRMSISGKAADLQSGKLKERQERSWEDTTLGAIIAEIARESGLVPAVDAELASRRYRWVGQEDENNLQFLRRLEARHNGLFSIKQGRLLFTSRGSGRSASGAPLGSIIITPGRLAPGSLKIEISDETKYSKVVADYQDHDRAERVSVEAAADATGDSVYRMPEPFASPGEAGNAANAKSKELQRGKGSFSFTCPGDNTIAAGLPLLFSGIRPGIDGVPYMIKTAVHEYSKSGGWTTRVNGTLYDGRSANEGAAASAATGKVAPDAAPGMPATPAQFLTPRR